jgi:DNA polymerase III epsilon subunit-like protein
MDKLIKNIEKNMNFSEDKELFSGTLVKGNTNYKIEYNEEQLNFINSSIENSKLLGIPGGGKTASIIGKVIYHYNKREINANDQFLILTFSRRASVDFLNKGRRQNKILFNTRNIKTLHSLAGKIIYKKLQKRSSSQDTVIISAIDLLNKENSNESKDSIKDMNEFKNLKVIFVDEAQDISFIQYELILKISQITKSSLILIGDPNQNIFQFQNGSDQYLLNHSEKTYQLIRNYRSTPHIVNFINHFRPWDSLTERMISTKEDNHPFNRKPIIFNGTIDEVIKDIIDKILSSPFPREEIAIIGPVKKCKPNSSSYTNIGLSLFTNLLYQHNIKFIKHYEETRNDEDMSNDIERVKDHINLMTIHGSKGLEFHQVFLINFHTSTFGILPTEEKYKEFKYLWYVGLSRSAYDLNIYVDKNKMVWNELKTCPSQLYETNNRPKIIKEIKFSTEIQPVYYSVTEILNSKRIISDEAMYNLEKMFKFNVETNPMFETFEEKNIKNYKEYATLYGMFIENVFNYYYCKKMNRRSDFVIKLEKILNNTIIIPKELISGYKLLKIRIPNIKDNVIKLSEINRYKNLFRKSEEDLYSYLCNELQHNYQKEFYIECYNDVSNYSKDLLLESIDYLSKQSEDKELFSSTNVPENILKITIFYHQMNHETAYLWNIDFTEELNDLQYYIDNIIKFVDNMDISENYKIHPFLKHPKLDLVGEMDMVSNNKIIDIKFSNNLNIKHILQVLLYNMIIDTSFKKDYKLELWNFHLGIIYNIKIDRENINTFKILKYIAQSLGRKMKNMIFMYDLETTGLCYSNKKIDIIERHIEEYTTKIIASTGFVKPVNVPFIPFQITKITGITKDMVYENGDSFDILQKDMKEIMNYCYKPIFIAHNGNSFDHKIMIERNLLSYEDCKLLDSRVIIRLFLNDPITEKSLSDIFQHLFKFKPVIHRANSDVRMMREIFEKLNITEDKLLNM